MQIGQTDQDTWSDAEVNQIIGHAIVIKAEAQEISDYADDIAYALFFLVLIAGIYFGWMVSRYFLPDARDIGAKL